MWEAIINWINSKAYRCEHNYEEKYRTSVFLTEDATLPYQTKILFVCTKCCESKIIKI